MQSVIADAQPSLCPRTSGATGRHVTVGLVQTRWHADPEDHRAALAEGIGLAASQGARIVFLPELTMQRYMADTRPDPSQRSAAAEDLSDGPTMGFLSVQARSHGVFVNGSLFERTGPADERGYNTSVLVGPDGSMVQRTRKMHIPVTAGYYENEYFTPGPADPAEDYRVACLDLPGRPRMGMPTCWDEWFPEVARIYGLHGAEILAYPTAIGSEPDYPDFDTEPLWEQTIRAHGIANGMFMVATNRYGDEGRVRFYGSSFISDPFGRVLVQAPREADAVLVATLDLDQCADWMTLFPFRRTRRPDSYGALVNGSDVRDMEQTRSRT